MGDAAEEDGVSDGFDEVMSQHFRELKAQVERRFPGEELVGADRIGDPRGHSRARYSRPVYRYHFASGQVEEEVAG